MPKHLQRFRLSAQTLDRHQVGPNRLIGFTDRYGWIGFEECAEDLQGLIEGGHHWQTIVAGIGCARLSEKPNRQRQDGTDPADGGAEAGYDPTVQAARLGRSPNPGGRRLNLAGQCDALV